MDFELEGSKRENKQSEVKVSSKASESRQEEECVVKNDRQCATEYDTECRAVYASRCSTE